MGLIMIIPNQSIKRKREGGEANDGLILSYDNFPLPRHLWLSFILNVPTYPLWYEEHYLKG